MIRFQKTIPLLVLPLALLACQSSIFVPTASPLPPTPTVPPIPLGSVVETGEQPCLGVTCTRVTVACTGIPAVRASVRASGAADSGTVVLLSGGGGTELFSESGQLAADMMASLQADRFLTVEIAWDEPGVWDTAGHAVGSVALGCRFASLARWVRDNLHQGGLFVVQGNSGGAAQVAFALAYYGIDEFVDLANIGGGPPPCPLEIPQPERNQMQHRCLYANAAWDESLQPLLSGQPRLDYPNTTVHFYLGVYEDSLSITYTAMTFYQAIASQKTLQILPDTGHQIHLSQAGTQAMLASIRQAAAAAAATPQP